MQKSEVDFRYMRCRISRTEPIVRTAPLLSVAAANDGMPLLRSSEREDMAREWH